MAQNNFQINGSTGVTVSGVQQVISNAGEVEPKQERESLVKVLFLGANPAGTGQLRLDREVKAIADALRVAVEASRFKLEQSWAVTVHDLQDGLLHHNPDIVHLSGHGRSDGLLALEPDPATADLYSPYSGTSAPRNFVISLGKLFALARNRVRCVVLNACHSAELARTIAEHVDCVVGMSSSIGDEAALQFSRGFYHALGQGQSVRAAFDFGILQIGLSGSPDVEVPKLLGGRSAPESISFARA